MCMTTLSYIYTNIVLSGEIQNTAEASFMYPATLHLCKLSIYTVESVARKKIENTSLPCQFSTP